MRIFALRGVVGSQIGLRIEINGEQSFTAVVEIP